jgi:hypothetical protein
LAGLETSFAIDSTHFPTCHKRKWFDLKKDKAKEKRTTYKAHISSGVNTNIIAAIKVTPDQGEKGSEEDRIGDATQFPYLVAETAGRFRVLEVLADAAYCSALNFKIAKQVGAEFITRFTKRDKGLSGGDYTEAFLFQWEQPKEHFRRYGKRNNVESTNSAIKREFPGKLLFRTHQAIVNEILCRALIHNIYCLNMAKHVLGVEIKF